MKKQMISIVVPFYNEEGNILRFANELFINLPSLYVYEVVMVDDGSCDQTLRIIKQLARKDKRIKYLSFTRNFGHQSALKAGFDVSSGQAVITMDGDLQHPPKVIPKMLGLWTKGAKVVYAQRKGETGLPYLKQLTSNMFYALINKMSDTKIILEAADFRLLDRDVVNQIKNSHETTLFLRGLVAWMGYEHRSVFYKQPKRVWGKSKYSYTKMIKLALDAITSFSTVPLRLATIIGLVMSLFSGIYGLYAVIMFIIDRQHVIIGWPSVIISVLFIGGLQLMILGIIGEYIGKIFIETKNRPLYLVKEKKV